MERRSRFAFIFLFTAEAAVTTTQACDLCGCFTPQLETQPRFDDDAGFGSLAGPSHSWPSGLYGAVAEQFTHFGTVQVDGREVPTEQFELENASESGIHMT